MEQRPGITPYGTKAPFLHPESYVDPFARIIGEVYLAEGSSIWPMAVLRADSCQVRVGRRAAVLDLALLERELADPSSLRHQVFSAYAHLLRLRSAEPAFHPHGDQQVLFLNDSLFSLLRISRGGRSRVLCLHNVSARSQSVQIKPDEVELPPGNWRDLLTGETFFVGKDGVSLIMPPHTARWLRT